MIGCEIPTLLCTLGSVRSWRASRARHGHPSGTVGAGTALLYAVCVWSGRVGRGAPGSGGGAGGGGVRPAGRPDRHAQAVPAERTRLDGELGARQPRVDATEAATLEGRESRGIVGGRVVGSQPALYEFSILQLYKKKLFAAWVSHCG